jgi:hypothetical protein
MVPEFLNLVVSLGTNKCYRCETKALSQTPDRVEHGPGHGNLWLNTIIILIARVHMFKEIDVYGHAVACGMNSSLNQVFLNTLFQRLTTF